MWRRIRRWTWRLGLGLVGLVVAVVAVLLIAIHTDWGRERLRLRAVAALRAAFPGGASIGRLEGSALGDLVLRDVVLRDAAGRPAITARRVRINVGYLALLRGELELEALDVDGATVVVVVPPGQPPNLAGAYRSSGPLTWDVALRRVRVRELAVTIDRGGDLEHLDHLAIDAAVVVSAAGPIAARLEVIGVARERGGAAISIAGQAWLDGSSVVVPSARAALGRSVLEVHALTYRAGAEGRGVVDATIAGATLHGALTATDLGGRPRLEGVVDVAGVDLARLGPRRPTSALAGRLLVDLTLDPGATGLGAVAGHASITARGAVAGVMLDEVEAAVAVADGVARLDVHAQGPDADAVTLHAELETAGWVGAATELTVRGAVHGRGLRRGELAIGDVRVDVVATGPTSAPRGELTIAARDLRSGAQRVPELAATVRGALGGPLDVELEVRDRARAARVVVAGRVTLGPPGGPYLPAAIELGGYQLDLARVHLTGGGGQVTLEDERTIVRGLRLRGMGGALALDLTAGRGRRAGQLAGQLELTALDLAALRGLPGVPPQLGGVVAVRADLRGRGRALTGEVHVSATGVVVRDGAIPVDVAIGVEVGRRVEVVVSASGPELGVLAATLEVTPPRRLDDLRGWRRIDRAAIHGLKVEAQRLDLARLSQLVGQAPSVEGSLDAEIVLDPTRATATFHGRGLIVAGAPAPLDLDLDLDLDDPTTARVAARATLREIARMTLTTGVRMPSRPFDLAAWRATDLHSLQAVDLTIDAVEIDAALAGRLGLGDLRGTIGATVRAEPGLGAITVHVAGRDVIAGPLATPAVVVIDATVDGTGTRATLDLGLAGATVVTGAITAPITIARVRSGRLDLRTVPLTGTLQVADTAVATITGALAQPGRLGGRVRGDATVSGTLAAPAATVALIVSDLGSRTPRAGGASRGGIRELTVDGRYQDGALHAEVRGQAVDGGTLALVTDVDRARPEAARGSLQASRFQLAPLTRLMPTMLLGVRGVLDADLQVRGVTLATARVTGTARVSGGQVPISDTVGNLRDAAVEVTFRGDDARMTVAGALESGRIDVVATARVAGVIPQTAQLDVTVRDVTLITTAAPRLDGKLHVDVTRDHDRWRAVARIREATVELPEDEGRVLHPAGKPSDVVFTSDLRAGVTAPRTRTMALRAWLGARPARPWLEVALGIEPVTVISEQLRGEVSGQLQLAIGDDGASVDGRVGVVRGNVVLFERRYGIRRADVAFDGGIDPLLDVQLEYEVPQLTLRVGIGGRLSKPTLTLSSDPNTYTEGQLLAILLGGAPGTPGNENAAFAGGVAATTASQLVGGFFTRRLPVRLDVFHYEAVTSASSGAFVVGRWLTSTILLLLRTRLEARPDENVNEAEVELWLTPRVLVQGTAGDRGVLGLDLLWNRRW